MANPTAIQRVSFRHEAIIDYILANPNARLKDVALHFDVTPPWLSQIIHSDCFIQHIASRRDQISSPILIELHEKLASVAHLALDRLNEKVPLLDNASDLKDVADMALDNLGYGTSKGSVGLHLHNHQHFSQPIAPSLVSEARSRVGVIKPPAAPPVLVDDHEDIQDAEYHILEPGAEPVPAG
ncbi:MAG: hypothetical protein FVQ79_00210 [Planctomycetes bacterium]|nr:hypothetical protein [Planctomycetota bacterium]